MPTDLLGNVGTAAIKELGIESAVLLVTNALGTEPCFLSSLRVRKELT
jgi:hypothetical protein